MYFLINDCKLIIIKMKKINPDIFYFMLLLLIVLILKYPVMSLPYYWDDMNYVISTVDYIYHNAFTPFLWEYSFGHPPFFFLFVGALFKIFGNSNLIAHFSVAFFSFLTLFFTYLIGKTLSDRKVGMMASLMLFFAPIFFSYSGLFLLDIPLTALTTMTIYFAIKSKPFLYFLFASLTILTKIPGVIVVGGVILSKMIKEKRINKNVIIYALPILTFIFLLFLNELHYGKFLYPAGVSMLNLNIVKNAFNLLIILKTILFDQYRWILTSIFILSVINLKFIKNKKKTYFIPHLSLTVILFLFLYNLPLLTNYLIDYFPNIEYYFYLVRSFSLLFSILFLFILLFYKNIVPVIAMIKAPELTFTSLLMILFYIFIIPFSPRYILPIFPILFLFFSSSLVSLFKRYSYLALVAMIIIFSINLSGDRSTVGFTLETNMEYVDAIKTQISGAEYIEENFPNSTVLASFPLSSELKYPYSGYVKKPINVVTYPHFLGLTGHEKNYTIFLHPQFNQNQTIDLNSIDFYYYTPQEFSSVIPDIAKKLNLTLIKRFESNNKSVEIYRVNKNIKYPIYSFDNF